MKDNKLYKVLRIIFLTLAIISLVFTLCKKVGLCASVDTSDNPSSFDNLVPIPIGVGYGYDSTQFVIDDSWIGRALELCENSSVMPYVTPTVKMIAISEYASGIGNDYVDFYAFYQRNDTPYSITYNTSNSSNIRLIASNAIYVSFRYTISTDSFSTPVYQGSQTWYLSLYGNNNYCFGNSQLAGKYIFNRNTFFTHYPVYVSSDLVGDYFQYISNDSGLTFSEGTVSTLPNLEPLTGTPDSSDTQSSLFDKLKGWLSTIQGNIQKGFKNIEENLTSFFKPYLDNIKDFFTWFTEPFDSEAASDSLESIQAISDIRALNNVIGTAGIFNWSDVSPASRVAFTFDFGGAVLPHHQYEINFDWYTGTVKTLILSILVTFLVVGLLVTIINNIPSMIHGHSGDSGGGSN